MAARDNRQKIAEGMFIEQGMTCKAIAGLVTVSEQTLSKWRKDANWDARRAEALASPHRIREILLKELQSVAEGNKASVDTNALAQINKTLSSFGNATPPNVVVAVLQGFDNWMAGQEPKTAIQFLDWHKLYLQHVITQHG